MFSLKGLSERWRFLIYALGIVALPFLAIFIVNLFSQTLKQNLDNWADRIFSQQEPYTRLRIEGPVRQKGFIRVSDQVSLRDLVKRAGGAEFGYQIPKEYWELSFSNDFFLGKNETSLDLSGYLKKRQKQNKWNNKNQKKKVYYDRINRGLNESGDRNERRSRYR